MIEIRESDFSIDDVIARMKKREVGAIVTFLGTVRGRSKGREVEKLQFETYKEMAMGGLGEIKEIAMRRFEIEDVAIIHRVGALAVSENIVLIAVSAEHRKDAFAACEFLIDELKNVVPIWKKEFTPSGEYWIEGEG
ncbi:MAG: molybdenum cofactor biosynthesis protein MoaE [Methanocellales archaeon]|nr:molybdenum cofactor biosynthesis protein MoaE [Methanocellales archaeon]